MPGTVERRREASIASDDVFSSAERSLQPPIVDMQVVPVYVQVGCAYSPYRPWPWPRFSPPDARARSAHPCAGPLSAGDARLRAAVGGGQLQGRVELRVGELAAGGDAELPEHLAQGVVDGG